MRPAVHSLSHAVNRWLHIVGAWVGVGLMALTALDVGGRYFFNHPVAGTVELTSLALVLMVFTSLGYTHHKGEHLAIDLVYKCFPGWLQIAVDFLTGISTMLLVSLIAWQLWLLGGRKLQGGDVSTVLALPFYPWVYLAALGAGCYAMAVLASLLNGKGAAGGG